MNEARPYQGYPYVNPIVTDAPSIDAATAAKWANLPRRPVGSPSRPVGLPSRPADSSRPGGSPSRPVDSPTRPAESPSRPVGLPSRPAESPTRPGGSLTRPGGSPNSPVGLPSRQGVSPSRPINPPSRPMDMPGGSGSSYNYESPGPSDRVTESPAKRDPDPVVYIDLPEDAMPSGSSQNENSRPGFVEVEDTIFYDPFENRRINRPKDQMSDTSSDSSTYTPARPAPPIPPVHSPRRPRPDTLDLNTPSPAPNLNQAFNKETQVYGGDGLNVTPLPVSEFPEPPPAYSEVYVIPVTPVNPAPVTPVNPQELTPPPTQVLITPQPDGDRKFLQCQFCGTNIHSIVIKENGFISHLLAFTFLVFGLFPLTFFVYCSDWCKYKNHYCSNCNKKICYESPCICTKPVYY